MSTMKNAYFGDTSEKTFGFLKVNRVSFPNNTHLFTLQSIKGDERERVSISANPYDAASELRRIADWMDGTNH
jgi:hypothetical protein